MRNDQFWSSGSNCIPAILNTVNNLSEDSYFFAINMNSHWTWCSESARRHFEISDAYVEDVMAALAKHVYPEDMEEYNWAVERRIRGEDIEGELCIRMKGIQNDYDMFSFHMERYRDPEVGADYILWVLKNENILPDFDALTDLYSKTKYHSDLERVIEETDGCLAILKIRIEGFNTLNIIYGTAFANHVLQEVALAFIFKMDENSAVYRQDGEKFAFILKHCSRDALIAYDQRVRQILSEEIYVEGQHISLKISSGAIILEHYRGEASVVQSQVAYALNHSTREHQGNLIIFNDEVQLSRHVDLDLMKVIHQSVRDNCKGFYVEYQPVVNSKNSAIVGAEALVRWSMEPYGKVPPGMFIEWMETDSSMYDLGNFVLRTALNDIKPLLEICPKFFINVNISARQLERPEFRGAVLQMLEETGFPSENLCMELTERCRDFPVGIIRKEVEFFQSHGIRFAMDDYGTGSASSDIVMNVPMDEIKLDMSFIRGIQENPKNQAMVKSIVEFANESGMSTCLEGVETEELQNYLRSYGATWFQGYYYSKPVPIAEVEKLLRSQDG